MYFFEEFRLILFVFEYLSIGGGEEECLILLNGGVDVGVDFEEFFGAGE